MEDCLNDDEPNCSESFMKTMSMRIILDADRLSRF
jgi:hypothetical protein